MGYIVKEFQDYWTDNFQSGSAAKDLQDYLARADVGDYCSISYAVNTDRYYRPITRILLVHN